MSSKKALAMTKPRLAHSSKVEVKIRDSDRRQNKSAANEFKKRKI